MSTNHTDLIQKLQAARRVSVPIAAVNTPDQPALVEAVRENLDADPLVPKRPKPTPMLRWDFVRGIHAINEPGVEALVAMGDGVMEDTRRDPIAALAAAISMPQDSVLFILQAQRWVHDGGVCQGLINLRDQYKSNGRLLILVGTGITLPPEVSSDVVQWTEQLPDDERLTAIVREQVEGAAGQFERPPGPELVKRAAVALRGTSAFGAEQLAAMSLRKKGDGIDIDTLHTQARALIEQTPGLTFERGRETFADIGGLDFAKTWGKRTFNGPCAPAVIVRVEELEKAMAGAKGDLSGTSGDALAVLLSEMEDNNWDGMMAYGPPGCSKSLFGKSLANSHGAKAVVFDINACKDSLVGGSERKIRQAMQVIRTIGGDRVFFIASCNAMDTVQAALQRRFRTGVWFFDVPDDAERARIWQIQRAKYKIAADDPTPDENDLTGADIRNICERSYKLACSLADARQYVVPLKTQSPADIRAAREMAHGRFTDASRGGVYDRGRIGVVVPAKGRKVSVA